MAVNETVGLTSKKNVIVFDQKVENKIVKEDSNKIKTLSRIMNESGFNIIKCVPSTYDAIGSKMYSVNTSEKRNYILVECALQDNGRLEVQAKRFNAFLKSKKYNVITGRIFEDGDYPTFKAIVKIA